MLLRVDLDDGPRLADVGFGGEGLLRPIPMEPGRESRQFHRSYRVVEEGHALVLQSLQPEGWLDLYAFTLEPNLPVDYEMSNHFTSTYPESIFRRGPIVQRPTPEARYILRGGELTVQRGDETASRQLEDEEELLRVLSETFGLDFPPGTRFHATVS
jgi:N-hydroxyarylamine O-acetyltransferase